MGAKTKFGNRSVMRRYDQTRDATRDAMKKARYFLVRKKDSVVLGFGHDRACCVKLAFALKTYPWRTLEVQYR